MQVVHARASRRRARTARLLVLALLAQVLLAGAAVAQAPTATLRLAHDLVGATGTVPNLGTAPDGDLVLVGDWSPGVDGVAFTGDRKALQSVGVADPGGRTLGCAPGAAAGIGVRMSWAPPADGCTSDSTNVAQVGRSGDGKTQVKIQLSSCNASRNRTFVECRVAGSTSLKTHRPIRATEPLPGAGTYLVHCVKAPQSGSRTDVRVLVTTLDTGAAGVVADTSERVPAIGRLQSSADLSVANKTPLPKQRKNTDQFVGEIGAVALCDGDAAAAVHDCLSDHLGGSAPPADPPPDDPPPDDPPPDDPPPDDPPPDDGFEHVTNTSLEADDAGWTGTWSKDKHVYVRRVTDVGRTGTASMRVRATAGASRESSGFQSQPHWVTDAIAGRTYRATIWVKPNSSGQKVRLRVLEKQGSTTLARSTKTLVTEGTGWQKVTTEIQAEQDGSTIRFIVYGRRMDEGDTFHVDDLSLVSLATP